MGVGNLSGYSYVASLMAQLRGGMSQQFQGVSGSVTSDASSASTAATAAASAIVASRMGQGWQQVTSLSVDSLDIFA